MRVLIIWSNYQLSTNYQRSGLSQCSVRPSWAPVEPDRAPAEPDGLRPSRSSPPSASGRAQPGSPGQAATTQTQPRLRPAHVHVHEVVLHRMRGMYMKRSIWKYTNTYKDAGQSGVVAYTAPGSFYLIALLFAKICHCAEPSNFCAQTIFRLPSF